MGLSINLVEMKVKVFDPFNRTPEHNAAVADAIVVLFNRIFPAPGSESVVVVEYVSRTESPP